MTRSPLIFYFIFSGLLYASLLKASIPAKPEEIQNCAGRNMNFETLQFSALNLHEYLDGGAPFYIQNGFKNLKVISGSASSGSLRAEIEEYEFTDKLSAFGVISQLRNGDFLYIKKSNPAYFTENQLGILQKNFFYRITFTGEGFKLSNKIIECYKKLFSENSDLSELYSIFPEKKLLNKSLIYYPSGLPNYKGLGGVVTGKTKIKEKFLTLVGKHFQDKSELEKFLQSSLNNPNFKSIRFKKDIFYLRENNTKDNFIWFRSFGTNLKGFLSSSDNINEASDIFDKIY